jgi:TRAP-type C4-dicarboxylate transport system permease small subunit
MQTKNKYNLAMDKVHKASEFVVALAFILLCLSVSVQVTARYVFDHAFGWGEELPIFLFLWVSFLAAAVAYRDGSHLSVDFIVAKFPKKLRYAIYYLNLALSLLFMGILIYYETGMTRAAMHSTFVVLKISKAYCYVGIPISCFLFVLFIIERMMTKNPKLPEDDQAQQ